MEIFCSANSALGFSSGGSTVWLDALHGMVPGLSPLPEALWSRFTSDRTLYLATHTHEDHFSPAAAERLLQQYRNVRLWAPGYKGNTAAPQKGTETLLFREGALCVTLLRGLHDGAAFANVPAYMAIVSDGSTCAAAASDVQITPALVQQIRSLCPGGIHALFLNPYQWGQPGQRSLWASLVPTQIRLYHLPFPEDDTCGLWRMAQQSVIAAPAATLPALMRSFCLPDSE